ncbi:autotransporter assembly complex family protein [Agaribacterium sp. ZY112]|uniref:autotransporter assembly complex protein TamA n=1 Tax=Agaribacterium sp. ZY112 TaxID=3233574 RepID=UPI0035238D64
MPSQLPSKCFLLLSLLLLSLLAIGKSSHALEIELLGVNTELENNLRAHLSKLTKQKCDKQQTRTDFNKILWHEDIHRAAQALGYYQLEFQANWYKQTCWKLKLDIKPGPRTQIKDINISLLGPGESDLNLKKIRHELVIQEGQALNHQSYERSKKQIFRYLQNKGYWHSRWLKSQLKIDKEQNLAFIELELYTGDVSTFGDAIFPNVGLDSVLLERLIDLPYGSRYSKSELDKAYERLQSTPYFSSVWLQPLFNSDTKTDTEVELSLASKYQLSAGIGFSSDQGPRVSGRLEDNYFNSHGHSWKLDATWSEDVSEVNLNYRVPLKKPASQWLDNQFGFYREQTDSYNSKTYSIGLRYVEELNELWNWFAASNFQHDIYQLEGDLERSFSDLFIPSIGANLLILDSPSWTRQGIRIETELLGSTDKLLSDTEFIQLKLNGKAILPIGTRNRLISRGQLGVTGKEEFNELPPSIRFYTGGDNSVRGYAYNSIGEVDENGNVQGGSHLVVGSLEFDTRFIGSWSAATFFDVGSAFDHSADFKRGLGVGLRWHSPVGPVRFDLARPLDDNNNEYAFHFSIGADL